MSLLNKVTPRSWNPAKWNSHDWGKVGLGAATLGTAPLVIMATIDATKKYLKHKTYADPLDKSKILAEQRQSSINAYQNLMGQQRSLMSSGDYSNPAMTQYLLGKQSALGMQHTLSESDTLAAKTSLDIDKYNQEYKEARRKEDSQKRSDFLGNVAKTAAAAAATYFTSGAASPLLAAQLANWGSSEIGKSKPFQVTDRYTLNPDQVTPESSMLGTPQSRYNLGVGSGMDFQSASGNPEDTMPDYLKTPYDGKYAMNSQVSQYGISPIEDIQYSDKNLKNPEESDPREIDDFLASLKGGRKYSWKKSSPDYDGGEDHTGVYTQDLQKSSIGKSVLKRGPAGQGIDIGQLSTALAAGLGHLYEKVSELEHRRSRENA